MEVATQDEKVWAGVLDLKNKLNHTLRECREVVAQRTAFEISQQEVIIHRVP